MPAMVCSKLPGVSVAASCTAAVAPCSEISRWVMPLFEQALGEGAVAQQAAVAW